MRLRNKMLIIALFPFFFHRAYPADASFNKFDCSSPTREHVEKIDTARKLIAATFKKATVGRCIPTGVDSKLPACPQFANQIGVLDSRFPTGAIFIHYLPYPDQNVFLTETLEAFHKANPRGVANIVVSASDVAKLVDNNQVLKGIVDQPWINIVVITGGADYAKWTRDIFRFFIQEGKPVFFHLNYGDESKLKLADNTPCELSRQCGFSYLGQNDLKDGRDPLQGLGIDSGGNLGATPGGSLYRGVIATKGFNDQRDLKIAAMIQRPQSRVDEKLIYPLFTPVQLRNAQTFRSAKLDWVKIDTSFLHIGHADELISIVKTKDPAPCDFAILRPSIERAIEIMRATKSLASPGSVCTELKLSNLRDRKLSEVEYSRIAKSNCIDGTDLKTYLNGADFNNILNFKSRNLINGILKNNAKIIAERISKDTACKKARVIEVPTLFKDGKSILPNQVNLLELNPLDGEPSVIVARSYFEPFDRDLEKSLSKLGIKVLFVSDLGYASEGGDVHCGTNEIRLCKGL